MSATPYNTSMIAPEIVSRNEFETREWVWKCGRIARVQGCPIHFNLYHPLAQPKLYEAWRLGWQDEPLRVITEFSKNCTFTTTTSLQKIARKIKWALHKVPSSSMWTAPSIRTRARINLG